MKIDKLYIRSRFKNLKDVTVDFDEEKLMTVIVGGNGSGKSNVLEALVAIFRNLDLGESAPFSYEIIYWLGVGENARRISVDADPCRGTPAKQYQIHACSAAELERGQVLSKAIPFSMVKRDKKTADAPYLPKHLFAYYSGPSDRLEKYFETHRTTFYKKLLKSEIDLGGDIRPLFYAKPYHSQFVLLAFFMDDSYEKEKEFLREHLGITGLDSVHFVMRKPGWAKDVNKKELFWGASGVVREFLDLLYPHALAPVKVSRKEKTSLSGTKAPPNEFFHLFLRDLDALRDFAKGLTPDVFFKMLESTLLSEIISEVNIRVQVESSDEPLTFRELSEGEQQLLTVLGLLKFTGEHDSLFLLDEPDTHLNPAWAVKYLGFLENFVPDHQTSHVLMATHHPLSIAGLEKEQVQVMKYEDRQVSASAPQESPRGMGINLILRSDMFGMQTTLDSDTHQKVKSRNKLAAQETLSQGELKELGALNVKLDALGYNWSSDDPDYMEFLQEKYHSKTGEDI